jgi:plastocyanin
MIEVKLVMRGVALGVVITQLTTATPAWAAEEAPRPPPTAADFARLEAEVKGQRQLIIQMMQTEQQRYDMLLKLIGAGATAITPVVIPPAEAPTKGGKGSAATPLTATPEAPVRRVATVEGKVSISGGDLSDVYVFVENVKAAPVRGRSIEIKQENKQFSPRLAVVQTGTQVSFPNLDTVFHNVFSTSPKNAFDLGSYRAGDKARTVILTAPGLVEIFCNVHQKMNANVMVVPNNLFTKVRSDGSFKIDNVPVGTRKLVAWSPSTRPINQKVEVTPAGVHATFALEYEEAKAHANKFGQAYGSYK